MLTMKKERDIYSKNIEKFEKFLSKKESKQDKIETDKCNSKKEVKKDEVSINNFNNI